MRCWRISASVTVTVLALALGACGGDDEQGEESASTPEPTATATATEAPGGGRTEEAGRGRLDVKAPADGSLKFDKQQYTAKPGTVRLDFDNPSTVPHALAIEGDQGRVSDETGTFTEDSEVLTVDLPRGEYRLWCPVGNHAQAGMEATLTVK